jgi:hypothetical protein
VTWDDTYVRHSEQFADSQVVFIVDFAQVERISRIYPGPRLLAQAGTHYHKTNIVSLDAIEYLDEMIYALSTVVRAHSADGDHHLFEWNAELFLDVFLGLIQNREVLIVDGVVRDEHLRPQVGIQKIAARLRIKD